MRNKQNRHPAFVSQFPDQIQNLSLNRHVQCRRRLVGDQQLRVTGQRHGDHDSLLLTTRHFMRIFFQRLNGVGNANFFKQSPGSIERFSAADLLVQ